MAERFIKLQSFPENLYTDMAPVVIVAGNLLKDNQLSRVLAQLKIQNIDKRTINEMTLQFRLMDVNGGVLDNAYVCKIEHIQIAENDFYGSKNPVTIPNANVHSCDIKVTQVKFADGTAWNCGNNWAPLDTTINIRDVKEKRHRQMSEETRKKEKEEHEARVREEKYRAEKSKETKKMLTIIASIIACIAVLVAIFAPIVKEKQEEKARVVAEAKKEVIIESLVGTSWVKTHKFYNGGKLLESDKTITFIDNETYEETYRSETESKKWEFDSFSEDNNEVDASFLHQYAYIILDGEKTKINYLEKDRTPYGIEIEGDTKFNGEGDYWEKIK